MKYTAILVHVVVFIVSLSSSYAVKNTFRAKKLKLYNSAHKKALSPLGRCQGPCKLDEDCLGDLVCSKPERGKFMMGCRGEANAHKGYCVAQYEYPLYFPPSDDMGMRFSKVHFDGKPPPQAHDVLPLTSKDYPLNADMAEFLRSSNCISVVMYDDCEECDMLVEEIIYQVGGYPAQVSSDDSSPFWDELGEVIQRQKERVANADPYNVLPIPDIWKIDGLTLEQVAEFVHDELAGTHHMDYLRQLISEGFTVNRTMIPAPGKSEFLRREVALAAITTWAVSLVGPYNFACKYYVGRPRPEELAWQIAQGYLTDRDGVPVDVMNDINDFELKSQFNFTAYPEGSPAHPSWPAMHSAGSAASLWMPVVMNLTPRQICQTKIVDWAVSYARTVAGVHYPSDNIAGLNLGQESFPGNCRTIWKKSSGHTHPM